MTKPFSLLALTLLAAGTAAAQDAAPAATEAASAPVEPAPAAADDGRSAFTRQGFYIAPMASYLKVHSGRDTDDGMGGTFLIGTRGDVASFEIFAHYLSLPWDKGPAKLTGGGVDLLFGPYGDSPILNNVFGLVGFGLHKREDHPYYTTDDTTIFGDVGAGYFHPVTIFGSEMALRGEVRYRYDSQPPPRPAGTLAAYNDWLINVGLQIPFGEKPMPPPAPAPVAVVPAVEPTPEPAPVVVAETPPEPVVEAPPAEPTLETVKAGESIVLKGVNFETASARLTANAKTLLIEVAEKLVTRQDLKVEIGGHTDARGSDAYNQTLSEKRAQSVVDFLAAQGVNPERMTAVGYGEAQPIDSNETDEGRERNRRVELKAL